MLRSFYTAVSGIQEGTTRQEVAVNNLTNVNTVGFKRDMVVSFPSIQMLLSRQEPDITLASLGGKGVSLASIGSGVYTDQIVTDFSPGPLKATGEPLDLALAGEGFFRVQTPEGERYTRDGRFSRDAVGRLVTLDGYPVQGDQGPIALDEGPIGVFQDGTVTCGEKPVGKLSIVNFQEIAFLEKCGQNLFSAPVGAAQEMPTEEVHISQGYLEMSNVDLMEAMVEMMTVARIYQSNQRMIQTQDELLSRAINEMGRIA